MSKEDAMANAVTDKPLTFRPPSSSPAKSVSPWSPPNPKFLHGTWHVTHSTLPMWKSNRNVTITYTPAPSPSGANDNIVKYQPLQSDKWKEVHGLEKPNPEVPAAYTWRGKGWLMIASSHWEVLGYGDDEGDWLVTFFQKTLFTPAGIDICVRRKGGISEDLMQKIRGEMKKVDDQSFREQADKIFAVKHDW